MAVFYVHYTHYSMCASSVMSGVEWMVVGTRTIQKNTSRFDEILGSIKSISHETGLFCLTWNSGSLVILLSMCASSVMSGVEWMVVETRTIQKNPSRFDEILGSIHPDSFCHERFEAYILVFVSWPNLIRLPYSNSRLSPQPVTLKRLSKRSLLEPACCKTRQKSLNQETGLGNREHTNIPNDTKLILDY